MSYFLLYHNETIVLASGKTLSRMFARTRIKYSFLVLGSSPRTKSCSNLLFGTGRSHFHLESTGNGRPQAPNPKTLPGPNPTIRAQGLSENLRASINDTGVPRKAGLGLDHALEVQDLLDAIQISVQKLVQRGEQSQTRVAGVFAGLGWFHRVAHNPIGLLVVGIGSDVGRGSQDSRLWTVNGLFV